MFGMLLTNTCEPYGRPAARSLIVAENCDWKSAMLLGSGGDATAMDGEARMAKARTRTTLRRRIYDPLSLVLTDARTLTFASRNASERPGSAGSPAKPKPT